MSDPADILYDLGYRPEDDSWDTDGRLTYMHDDDADRNFLFILRQRLAFLGWHRDTKALRTFRHETTGEIIEIEPGGDSDGHLLHYMKATVA